MLALSTILTTGLVGLAVLDSVNAASTGQRAINAKKIKTSVFARASPPPPFSLSFLSLEALEVDDLTDLDYSTAGNYSVVDGVFIQVPEPPPPSLFSLPTILTSRFSHHQSSGDFNATAFDVFNATESFGLVDKSSGRWQNLTECVSPPPSPPSPFLPVLMNVDGIKGTLRSSTLRRTRTRRTR